MLMQCNQHFSIYKMKASNRHSEIDVWTEYARHLQTGIQLGCAEAKDIIESLGGLPSSRRNEMTRLRDQLMLGVSHFKCRNDLASADRLLK